MTQSKEEKMKRKILVVKSNTLYKNKVFEGFCAAKDFDFENIIVNNFEYQVRGDMEIDNSYQQPIPYAIIMNTKTKKIIAYQRGSSSSHSGEQRLYGKWSFGIGGHIELEQKDAENPLHETLIKEIKEEIGLKSIVKFSVLGYINDNSDEVGKVHFGVLYIVYTNDESIEIGDGEIQQVYFKTENEIDNIIKSPDCDVESRSHIAWDAYKSINL